MASFFIVKIKLFLFFQCCENQTRDDLRSNYRIGAWKSLRWLVLSVLRKSDRNLPVLYVFDDAPVEDSGLCYGNRE